MHSDDRLAALAEKLKDEVESLPMQDQPEPAEAVPIRVRGHGANINVGGMQVNISSTPRVDLLTAAKPPPPGTRVEQLTQVQRLRALVAEYPTQVVIVLLTGLVLGKLL